MDFESTGHGNTLAANALDRAGPRLKWVLSCDKGIAALGRCFQAGLEAFWATIREGQPPKKQDQLKELFDNYFLDPCVGHEFGELLRGHVLNMANLEFLLNPPSHDGTINISSFTKSILALQIGFFQNACSEPILSENLPLEILNDFIESPQEIAPINSINKSEDNAGGDIDANLISADSVVGRDQYNISINSITRENAKKDVANITSQKEDSRYLRSSYLNRVVEHSGFLSIGDINSTTATKNSISTLQLEAIYTPLLTYIFNQHENQNDEYTGRLLPVLERFNRHNRLVLLGNAGSGKSTFINLLALCMAGEHLGAYRANMKLLAAPLPAEYRAGGNIHQKWDHATFLPVRISLRDFAACGLLNRHERGTAGHLWRYIEDDLRSATLEDYAKDLKAELQQGGGLILLDGLDEVPDTEKMRLRVLEAIRDFVAIFKDCHFLISCRTDTYQKKKWELPGFDEAVIAQLNEGQIRRFVDCWYSALAHLKGIGSRSRPDVGQHL